MSLGLLKQIKLERVAGGGRERGSQLPLDQFWSVSGIQVTAGLGFQRSTHCLKLCSCMAAREGVRLAGVLLAIGVDAVVAGVVAALIGRGSVRILGLRYCSLESLYREPQKNVSRMLLRRLHALTDCVGIASDTVMMIPGAIIIAQGPRRPGGAHFLCGSRINFLEPGSILPAAMSLFLGACPGSGVPIISI